MGLPRAFFTCLLRKLQAFMSGFERFAHLVEDGILVMPRVVGSIILVFLCRFQTSSFTDPHGNVASLLARLRVLFVLDRFRFVLQSQIVPLQRSLLLVINGLLTIRPVARKGYGSIAHEAKPNGLFIRGL